MQRNTVDSGYKVCRPTWARLVGVVQHAFSIEAVGMMDGSVVFCDFNVRVHAAQRQTEF